MDFLLTPRSYLQFMSKVHAQSNHNPETDEHQVVNASFVLKNPLDRLVMEPVVAFNPAKAVAKFFALIQGAEWTDVNPELWPEDLYVDGDSEIIPSAVQALDSKQSVTLPYLRPRSLLGDFKPHLLLIQLVNNENSTLDVVAHFESMNIMTELPEDIFVITMLQEFIARWLGLELGQTFINAGLATLDVAHFNSFIKVKEAPRWPFVMTPMPYISINDLEEWHSTLLEILETPTMFLSSVHKPVFSNPEVHTYLKTLTSVIVTYAELTATPDISLLAYDEIKSASFKRLIRPIMTSHGITDTRRRLHAS